MIEWSDEQRMVQAAVRDFIAKEVVPVHRDLEHGERPPYDILRKLLRAFGMDAMARDRFARQIARDRAAAEGSAGAEPGAATPRDGGAEAANAAASMLSPAVATGAAAEPAPRASPAQRSSSAAASATRCRRGTASEWQYPA